MKQFYETYKNYEELPTVLTDFPKPTGNMFKDIYTFEFLDFLEPYKEHDLRKELLNNLSKSLLGMRPQFSLIAEENFVKKTSRDFRVFGFFLG